ncbi:unnamed protein product [Allacma fusca]|uniref:Uncharacterized protein n=1 Tax=Allacma fusca TaxID=39272 RepID=A0A8J2K387_9HEXA|nr:unnamed protein product [Allacma fusca]
MQPYVWLSLALILLHCCLLPLANGDSEEILGLGGSQNELTPILNCDQCGSQCKFKCGTRKFRLCCFRFHRKRRGEPERVSQWNRFPDFSPQEAVLHYED